MHIITCLKKTWQIIRQYINLYSGYNRPKHDGCLLEYHRHNLAGQGRVPPLKYLVPPKVSSHQGSVLPGWSFFLPSPVAFWGLGFDFPFFCKESLSLCAVHFTLDWTQCPCYLLRSKTSPSVLLEPQQSRKHLVIQSLTKVLSLIHFVETTANNLTFNLSIGFRNGSYES